MKALYLFLLCSAFSILLSCGKPGTGTPAPPAPATAGVKVLLTDDPAFYTAINVNLTGLEYNTSTDSAITTGWQPLTLSAPGIINLLSLQNGTSATLTNSQINPVGIKQLRLKFGNTGNTIVDNGVTHPLVIPSIIQQQGAIMTANYAVNANQTVTIWIDFNAASSVAHDIATNVYTLWPRLRTFDATQTGAIEGFTGPASSMATVTVRTDPGSTAPQVSILAFPAFNNNGYFKCVGLPPGNYTVTITPHAGSYTSQTIRPVQVAANQVISIGTKTLQAATFSSASQFTGNWYVHESVSKNIGGFVGVDSFMAPTIFQNDSTFGIVQTSRIPDPEWVASYPYANADTLWFIPLTTNRILKNTYQGNIGTYSINKDTLNFTYTFGAAGNFFVYLVSQQWIRQ